MSCDINNTEDTKEHNNARPTADTLLTVYNKIIPNKNPIVIISELIINL